MRVRPLRGERYQGRGLARQAPWLHARVGGLGAWVGHLLWLSAKDANALPLNSSSSGNDPMFITRLSMALQRHGTLANGIGCAEMVAATSLGTSLSAYAA